MYIYIYIYTIYIYISFEGILKENKNSLLPFVRRN